MVSNVVLANLSESWVIERLALLGTDGCHLCHSALVVIEAAIGYLPIEKDIIDFPDGIYKDLEVLIPVLFVGDDTCTLNQLSSGERALLPRQCLFWPFNEAEVQAFIASFI